MTSEKCGLLKTDIVLPILSLHGISLPPGDLDYVKKKTVKSDLISYKDALGLLTADPESQELVWVVKRGVPGSKAMSRISTTMSTVSSIGKRRGNEDVERVEPLV